MLCRIIVFLVVQLMGALSLCDASGTVLIEQRLWLADINASGRYVSSALTTNLDLKKDLGFTDAILPQTRVLWNMDPSNSVRLDYFGGNFTGSANRKERREFFGGLISREVRYHVEEKLGIRFWKAGWVHYGSKNPEDKIRLGFLLDVKSVSLNGAATLKAEMDGISPVTLKRQASWRITDPTVGFVVTGRPNDRFKYYIECAGLTNGKNGFLFADYEASIHWYLDAKKNTSLVAGYHTIRYDNYRKKEKSSLDSVKIAGAFYGIEKKI